MKRLSIVINSDIGFAISLVEVYANDRQAISRRVYPTRTESLGVVLFADGGATNFAKLKAWEIAPSNPF